MDSSTTLKPAVRVTRRRQVGDRLMHMITSSDSGLHDRLPAVETLADLFGASVGTVHLALEDLEAKGYLVKKHGAGTFIAARHQPLSLKDTVAVCMATGAHVWGDLWALLMSGLNERHLLPLGIEIRHEHRDRLIARFNHTTEAAFYLVHTSYDFPFDLFTQPAYRGKSVIALVGWASTVQWPGLYRVLSDYREGARMVARHLRQQGHRRVLLVGPPTDRWVVKGEWPAGGSPLFEFIRDWESGGGAWKFLSSQSADDAANPLIEDELISFLKPDCWPTAIFGSRDFEVWQAQQIIRRRAPELEGKVELIGYYNTPWSQAGGPPFSTVSLDLPSIAAEAMKILDALRSGDTTPQTRPVMIRPKLVVREKL